MSGRFVDPAWSGSRLCRGADCWGCDPDSYGGCGALSYRAGPTSAPKTRKVVRVNAGLEVSVRIRPDASTRWQVTDEVLDDAGACGLPTHKRIWLAVTRRDPLRIHRLDLIAMDAALSDTRDFLIQRNVPTLLSKLADIEELVDQQSQKLRDGSTVTLPWAELDTLRYDAGLEPSMKVTSKQ